MTNKERNDFNKFMQTEQGELLKTQMVYAKKNSDLAKALITRTDSKGNSLPVTRLKDLNTVIKDGDLISSRYQLVKPGTKKVVFKIDKDGLNGHNVNSGNRRTPVHDEYDDNNDDDNDND